MPKAAFLALPLFAALLQAAAPARADDKPKQLQKPIDAGSVDAGGTYRLSAEELAFDCKRLSGRMQVRILQLREMTPTAKTSALGHEMKQVTEPVASLMLGKSSSFNADPGKRGADDRAMLKAYNAQLAAKGCKTYDLDAELNAKPGTAPLLPTPKPAAAPTKPAAK
jgi:hypothetical protein